MKYTVTIHVTIEMIHFDILLKRGDSIKNGNAKGPIERINT